MPYAFTEQGVAMLSTVLNNSERAIEVNIYIMRVLFIKLREMILTHKELDKELAEKLAVLEKRWKKHDTEIQGIFEAIRQLMIVHDKPKRKKWAF